MPVSLAALSARSLGEAGRQIPRPAKRRLRPPAAAPAETDAVHPDLAELTGVIGELLDAGRLIDRITPALLADEFRFPERVLARWFKAAKYRAAATFLHGPARQLGVR